MVSCSSSSQFLTKGKKPSKVSKVSKQQRLSNKVSKGSSERVKKTSKRLRLSDDKLTFADSSGSCWRSPFVEFHHLPFPVNPQVYKESRRHDQSHYLDTVIRVIKDEYNRRSQLKPLLWESTITLPLEDVYTRLRIVSRGKRDFQLENSEVHMYDVFKSEGDVIVLVEGSPGIGKTTFCLKIAYDWAHDRIPKEFNFPQFEIVLLLKCRDIVGDLFEAITEQLLPKDTHECFRKKLMEFIKDFHFQPKVLIILDGLDELSKESKSYVDDLLLKKVLRFCYVLVTTRQERGIAVRQKVNFDMLLQIEGFTRKDAFDYIRKYFNSAGSEHVSTGKRLIIQIKKNSLLDALWNNPLNLLLLCVVFEDCQGELPSYRTELYQIIVCCILRRYCAKHDLEAPVDDRNLVRLFEDSLLVLGELAWRCLEEDRFSFREEELAEFESAIVNLAARELGLVFKEASLRKINPQHEYFFFHKTFQEYLAAFYLANKLLIKEVDFSESHLHFYDDITERYRQVFIFMSGILGEDARLLFEQIGKKLKKQNWDWHQCAEKEATFFLECFNESRNDEQVAIALSSFIPFPQTMTFDLSYEDTPTDVFIVLKACESFSQLQLPVHLALECSRWDIYANLDGDALADIIASNTQLQTLSFSGSVSEEITALLCKALAVDSTLHSFTLETTEWKSSCEVVAISDSMAANKTLTTVTLKLPYEMLKICIAILDKGLSADMPRTSLVLEIFGSWRETEAKDFKEILLNRSLTSLSLTLFGDMQDSVMTCVSEGLVANPSLQSLALTFYGKLSNTSVALLKDGFLGNRSLESLELKVFGELPTNWANISRTLHSAIKSTASFTVHPNVTGMVGTSQVACLCPVLNENLLASKLHSLAVNILGELDCSGANDLCKGLIASSVSCVTLNFKERVTDNVANCLFKHLNKLKTISKLTISIQGDLMGDRKNTLERLLCNQTYLFALNVSDSYSGDKICREVGLSADDSSSLTPVLTKVKDGCVTKLSVSVNNPDSISGDWGSTLCEGLAKSESLTTLSLTLNDIASIENIDALWDAVAKNKSFTALSLTLNNYNCTSEPMTCGLSNGLAKNSSLTTLSLTLNDCWVWVRMVANDLSDGLAKNTSLTTLSLTFNIQSDSNIDNHVMDYLSDGLAKNTSLTTLSLTVNNYCDSDWEGGMISDLSEGLTENMSLTTLILTLNNYRAFEGCMISGLSDGLMKNMSITTLILTLNNFSDFKGHMISGMSKRLTKNMSLTTLILTLNNYSDFKGSMIYGLSDWLAKNMSLTTLSLAVNNYSDFKGYMIYNPSDWLAKFISLTTLSLAINNYSSFDGDLTYGLIDGLANIKSLTTLSLTLNNHSYRPNSCVCALMNALVRNTSLVTLNLTLSDYNNFYEDWIHELADALARDTSLTSISLEVNVFSERNSNSESSSV
ncbi:NLR family CARD domain-containing protein 4 [Stylophora pistillata]|uniref:NLR family CARD domain-containing protein 4 n=1 Tax=Stylophora pistillata TaxID=50429 RepID=A0A2B4R6K7_STYPI|nr:NLR family CARD domain-containing protein 4 [Stylophora pistillata]